ncbi:hypothetical protein [Achromobacter ruhlandii]|uniref:hypothetical protein n=1 Tax=Achromobacter ruhlandii TaxID=72557 RepID=UPI0015F2C0C3|nr:hypothetical protein [Achromobacter ruhlandii]
MPTCNALQQNRIDRHQSVIVALIGENPVLAMREGACRVNRRVRGAFFKRGFYL